MTKMNLFGEITVMLFL